ncbi:hypothetical protein VKN78_07465 [Fusobacterium polymorphum]|uniref:hypothetical protein n=1 Tax=Fusobacterium nucleatum subsp. polymorphum TaxID=76857 RepID=UPI0011C35890|nr:hypothetical protein [Fusobacterium polymorphum]UTI53152.1 hypothetical protein NLJ26_00425 [Fusobacterium polymorphum]WRL67668.1 hypothetical protein VKN78_07465 [Fusobacterium polymorphum]
MSRANLGVFEADLSAILEAVNELVHLELLTDTEFAANVNFLSLRNLASNELLAYTYIFKESETCKNSLKDLILEK